jgi:membrane associated rhomboid family serine protease
VFTEPWFIVVAVAIGVLVGWAIGGVRGRPVLGALLGVFGLIGWIIALLIPRSTTDFSSASFDGETPRPPDLPHGTLPAHPDGSHHERPT